MHEENSLLKETPDQEESLSAEVTTSDLPSPPDAPVVENPADGSTEEVHNAKESVLDGTSDADNTEASSGSEETADADASSSDGENIADPEEAPSGEEDASDAETSAPAVVKIPYHERFYLRYREGKRSIPMDTDGTSAFLQNLGFDGGSLRQAREGKKCAESYRNADKGKNNQMRCSYCGAEISGVEFYRLPDGRLRCTSCSSTLIKSKEEAQALCDRVLSNMEKFFGATIEVPISVEIMEGRKLKRKLGIPLGTRDAQSMLILGAAMNKKNKYTIVLENGAPRISMIATFAHELTHIWQYTHWDNRKNFKKCAQSKRLLVYEGMAKWAEIQYLYLIGETNIARREEFIARQRQDEYGFGFCLYEDAYPLSRDVMSCDDSPFTEGKYPFEHPQA